eukprot:jgi/Chlat1/2387/Chrsp17S08735
MALSANKEAMPASSSYNAKGAGAKVSLDERWALIAAEAAKRQRAMESHYRAMKRRVLVEGVRNRVFALLSGPPKVGTYPPCPLPNLDLGSVAVVGAGISGLTAAYALARAGAKVVVFGLNERPGGAIRTYSEEDILWEAGPNSMVETTQNVANIISDLSLDDYQMFPPMSRQQFLMRNKKVIQRPDSPLSFITTPLLSTEAKMRILLEPFKWKRRPKQKLKGVTEEDESVASFAERHFGREPVDYLLNPFLAGVYGSDPDILAVNHVFPQLVALEERYGSVMVGALATAASAPFKKMAAKFLGAKSDGRPRGILDMGLRRLQRKGTFSFRRGMQTLPDALALRIGRENMFMECPVTGLELQTSGRWIVTCSPPGSRKPKQLSFDSVVMAAPWHNFRTMKLLKRGQRIPLETLPEIKYAPMSVLAMVFKEDQITRPLEGFGVLLPKKENLYTLGTLLSSTMFPNRVPPGHVLLTTFVGGTRSPDMASRPRFELMQYAMSDLRKLVGLEGGPLFCRHIHWKRAFPMFTKGYAKVLRAMEELEKELPGFYITGSHRGGLAVGKAMDHGYQTAERIAGDMLQKQVKSAVLAVQAMP